MSSRQAKTAVGNLAVSVLRDNWQTYWTCTLWADEKVLRDFMTGGSHARAMPLLMEICDEASVVRWLQEGENLPTWPEAYKRMQTEGRTSRLRHPSEAHKVFKIPPPTVRPSSAIRLK